MWASRIIVHGLVGVSLVGVAAPGNQAGEFPVQFFKLFLTFEIGFVLVVKGRGELSFFIAVDIYPPGLGDRLITLIGSSVASVAHIGNAFIF